MPHQRVRFRANLHAVRDALIRLEHGAVLGPLTDDSRSIILLVLAEVMNNIAEHAYRGEEGLASVCLWRKDGAVMARVVDRGLPAPALPTAAETPNPAELPEGGFGLPLIRLLARELAQSRRCGCNVMQLCVEGNNAA